MPAVTQAPMPFIVGCPRSGTTLLRLMLDSSPLLAIPPETGFLVNLTDLDGEGESLRQCFIETLTNFPPGAPAWPDFQISREALADTLRAITPFSVAQGVRAFYRLYAARFGKARWGEKTPTYGLHMRAIQRLLPEARFIHLIRDGRDVALSLCQQWFAPGKDMETLATYWVDVVSATHCQGAGFEWYKEVRYEDLIQQPRRTLLEICDFVQIPFVGAMERYYERAHARLSEHAARIDLNGCELVSRATRLKQQQATTMPLDPNRVFAWKTQMSAEERRQFESRAAPLLLELGYEVIGNQEDLAPLLNFGKHT